MDELEIIQRYVEKLRKKFDGKIAVLFSGGVDSGLVAFATKNFANAITIDSEFIFRYKIEDAINFAKKHGIIHKIVKLKCLDEEIKNNPLNRCYFCKRNIIKEIRKLGYDVILDGTNIDDLKEIRPGINALKDENVISPLLELNFGKEKIRKVMQEIDKEFALKPHESCIATRIPFNSEITIERLERIEKSEDYIRNLGVGTVRVRDHFPEAIIEVMMADFKLMIENSEKILKKFKNMGYDIVTLNLESYGGA